MEENKTLPTFVVLICLIILLGILSGKNNKNQISDAEFNNLTMLVLMEAGGEPHDGKVAVAATVINRFNNETNCPSINEIIFQPGQFSCCYDGAFIGNPSFDDYQEEVLQDAIKAVNEALDGKDPTRAHLGGGCLYYYNPNGIDSEEAAMRANIKKTYQIGNHVFYRVWDT